MDFNDLVLERIQFESDLLAGEILKEMFPGEDVRVFTDRGGNRRISVGGVDWTVESR